MNFHKLTIALILPMFIFSCTDSTESSEVDIEKLVEEVLSDDTNVSAGSPCELLSIVDVKSICGVSSEFEIVQQDKEYTYPTCTFKWEDGKVTHAMSVGGQELTVDMPSEIMLVMVANSNEGMFTQSTSVYKDGADVEGVGDFASWGTKMSQLTFLSKGYMFHVKLKVSNDSEDNKQKAKEVAELIISKL